MNLRGVSFQRRKHVSACPVSQLVHVSHAACPPSPVAEDPSALPCPTSSPYQAVTLPACSLNASPWMPAAVPHHCTFQGTVL